MTQSLENLSAWIDSVDTWDLFVEKVVPLLAIPDPLHGPLTVGEHRSVLQTICSCREVLSPVVQRLWLQALAPRRLWSPLLAIMGIASRSKQPIMWLNCLNTRFATTYSLAAAVPAPAVLDIFAPLDDGLAALGLEPTGDEDPEGQDALDVEVIAEYDRVAARLKATFGDEVEIPQAISASSTAELQTAINHFRERLAAVARQAREAARARPRSIGFLEAVTAIATPRKVPPEDGKGSAAESKAAKSKAKKAKKKKKKKRDSLSSNTSGDSSTSGDEADPEDRLNHKWGTRNVDPKIFKLSYPVSASIRVRYGVGVEDGYIGLAFLEDITRYGEQSLASWFKDQDFDDQKNKRVVSELRFLVFLADLHLRDARCVAAARSGCKILDSIGRRIYVLNGVYFEALGWLQAERLLPVTAVKSERGGAVSLMAGVSSQLAKISKAEKVLKGDVLGAEPAGGKGSGKGKDGSA